MYTLKTASITSCTHMAITMTTNVRYSTDGYADTHNPRLYTNTDNGLVLLRVNACHARVGSSENVIVFFSP